MKQSEIVLCVLCLFGCLLVGCGRTSDGISSAPPVATDASGSTTGNTAVTTASGTTGGGSPSSSVPSASGSTTVSSTISDTPGHTRTTTQSASVNTGTSSPSGQPSVPEAVIRPGTGVDVYGDNGGYNTNLLCGIDVYGRSFAPVSGMENDRDVGIFYFLWHGESSRTTHNIAEQLQNSPDVLWNPAVNTNQFHYWGEPLFGYYTSWDTWVLSRHVEMLTMAGVDYLVFDATNGFTYKQAYTALLEVLTRYQSWGWDVPQVAFYTNAASRITIQAVYEDIYRDGKYRSLWYCPDGKPLIIGELTTAEKTEYAWMLEQFDLRESQWPNAGFIKDAGIPWMEWTYPQPLRSSGIMNVSVAQHVNLPFSSSLLDASRNWGRGYDFASGKNRPENSRRGTNFQSQWDTVLANRNRVNNVFVTGWNEWVAQKLNIEGQVWFVDCASEEFSRDIEPMKGGYEDSFYLQLCDNIRRYKGEHRTVRASDTGTLSVSGPSSQWDGVRNVYYAVSQTTGARNAQSVDGKHTYIQSAPRNTVQQIKLLNNEETLYIYLQTEKAMTDTHHSDFMNVYLGVGEMKLTGWNGYDFVFSAGDKMLYTLDEAGRRTAVCQVEVTVQGNCLQAAIPRSALGAKTAKSVYFKVADGLNSTDIMNSYTTGNCLPMGRLSYYYAFG